MAKISFSKLNLKKSTEIKTVLVNEMEVEVKQYLPIDEKNGILELILQHAIEYNFVNPIKVEKYLHLFFVYKYTNISFTDKQRESEEEIYDILEANGVIDKLIQSCEDYEVLRGYVEEYIGRYENYQNTLYGVLSQVVNDIPEALGNAMGALEGLDLAKLSDTLKIVSENGGNQAAIAEAIMGQK